jgi:hypothetical protein
MYEQSKAKDIKAQTDTATISDDQRVEYNDAIERRDRIRAVAGVGWGAAAVAATAGLFLFMYDEPKIEAPPRPAKGDEDSPGDAQPEAAPTMEIGAAPYLLPGAAGATIVGRF